MLYLCLLVKPNLCCFFLILTYFDRWACSSSGSAPDLDRRGPTRHVVSPPPKQLPDPGEGARLRGCQQPSDAVWLSERLHQPGLLPSRLSVVSLF